MADVTGALHVTHNGQQYTLRLTMRVIAELQSRFGNNIAGILDGSAGDFPDMNAVLAVVESALIKGTPGIDAAKAAEIADDLLSADMGVISNLMVAAFPEAKAEAGNAKRPKRAA